jgi:hypothetical protein
MKPVPLRRVRILTRFFRCLYCDLTSICFFKSANRLASGSSCSMCFSSDCRLSTCFSERLEASGGFLGRHDRLETGTIEVLRLKLRTCVRILVLAKKP